MSGLSAKDCVPCRGGVPALTRAEIDKLLPEVPGWTLNAAGHLEKTYEHAGFRRGLEFVKKVGEMCEQQGHHGDLHLAWGKTRLEVWTHKIGGLVEADFIWAAKADALWAETPA
ncbi:MAG: 4a-hydroxytetrahydrobiopterin dehydratase [Elusimicrobiota bacterium]|nr:4a-hydroxytetrahydrobiopterin dehydratase [Elusimicrobiota bacterium]